VLPLSVFYLNYYRYEYGTNNKKKNPEKPDFTGLSGFFTLFPFVAWTYILNNFV